MQETLLKTRPKLASRFAVIAALAALPAIAAAGQQTPFPYEMIVIVDGAHGRLIKDGKYRKAIEKSMVSSRRQNPFELANNLCVAYTLAKEFEDASKACDQALPAVAESVEKAKSNPLLSSSIVQRTQDRNGAIAYSNRGVLRAMTGDAIGARADFEAAAALETAVMAPERNLRNLVAREGQ